MNAFSVWFYRDNENREGCRMKNNQEKANAKMNISNSSFDKMKKEKKHLDEKYSNFIWWALFYLLLGI